MSVFLFGCLIITQKPLTDLSLIFFGNTTGKLIAWFKNSKLSGLIVWAENMMLHEEKEIDKNH